MPAKGDGGRVLVVGGSFEYTGAPYFCAMGALRAGAELAYVICSADAAIPIKCYSPELVVYPLIPGPDDPELDFERVQSVIDRCDLAVIGPGLSRSYDALMSAGEIMRMLLVCGKRVILDGDGIYMITAYKSMLAGAPNKHLISMTPNANEFNKIIAAWNPNLDTKHVTESVQINKAFQKITILRKGPVDMAICCGKMRVVCSESSEKRCGGQGDILAGVFAQVIIEYEKNYPEMEGIDIPKYAAEEAFLVVREAAFRASKSRGNSLIASDILPLIGS